MGVFFTNPPPERVKQWKSKTALCYRAGKLNHGKSASGCYSALTASSFVSFATVFVVRTIQILTHPSLCVDGGWGSSVTASAPASLMVSDCAVSNFFFLDVTLTSLKPVTGEVGI